MLKSFLNLLKFIEKRLIPWIATIFFGFSAAWMLVEALSRQLFARSFAVSEELIVFSLLWAIFLILPQSGRSGFHIYVDLFLNNIGKRLKRVVTCITSILSLIYCGIIFYSVYQFIHHLYLMEIISESPLQLPMWFVFLALLFGAALMGLYYLECAVISVCDRKK